MYNIEDKILYIEDLIENQLKLDDKQYREFKDMMDSFESEEELNIILVKLSQHFVDKIDSGFNYSMKDIQKKINRICR